jgi:hypothetical protein
MSLPVGRTPMPMFARKRAARRRHLLRPTVFPNPTNMENFHVQSSIWRTAKSHTVETESSGRSTQYQSHRYIRAETSSLHTGRYHCSLDRVVRNSHTVKHNDTTLAGLGGVRWLARLDAILCLFLEDQPPGPDFKQNLSLAYFMPGIRNLGIRAWWAILHAFVVPANFRCSGSNLRHSDHSSVGTVVCQRS